MYEIVKSLCAQKGISVTALCKEFTGSDANLATWKKNNFKRETIARLADYFNVSTDYLFGRETDTSSFTEAEREIMSLVRQFTPFQQGKIAAMLQAELDKINGVVMTQADESPRIFGEKTVFGKK